MSRFPFFNFSPAVGEKVIVNPPKTAALGPMEEYASVYGYPKRKAVVFETDADGVKTGAILGVVKEELVLGSGNQFVGKVYYSRGLKQTNDTLEFSNDPETLLRNMGFNVVAGGAKDPKAEEPEVADEPTQAQANGDTEGDDRQAVRSLLTQLGQVLDRLFK